MDCLLEPVSEGMEYIYSYWLECLHITHNLLYIDFTNHNTDFVCSRILYMKIGDNKLEVSS